jgi:predicted nucleic acid-binding protein
VKATDSNLLVYASLDDHPASKACEAFIGSESTWLTSVVNLLELHSVLRGAYGLLDEQADIKFHDFYEALFVVDVTPDLAQSALPLRRSYRIDLHDAILLESCRRHGISVLATDDSRLAAACSALGLGVENPIDAALRSEMADWESSNLPAKGLRRILWRVHRWLEPEDAQIAATFHAVTKALSRLP